MEGDTETDLMGAGCILRSCISFCRMYMAPSLAVSFACGLIMYTYSMKAPAVIGVVVVATFWFKVATMVFFYFAMKRKAWNVFYYYKNVGVSARWLWGTALPFDFLTYVIALFIGYYIR